MSDTMVVMVAALAAEVLLLLFALLGFAWFRNRAAQRRDDKAIRVLVTRVKNAKTEREATIARFLGERMGLAGEPLEQLKTAMIRAELVLLQRFAGVYKKRDAGSAAQFDIDFLAALAPYQELQGSGVVVEGAGESEQERADMSELEALRAENARLSDELSVTMETMSRMLNEYSTMFSGDSPDDAVPAAALLGGGGAAVAAADDSESGAAEEQAEVLSDAEPSVASVVEPAAGSDAEAGVEIDDGPDASTETGPEVDVTQGPGDEVDVDIDVAAQDDIDALFASESDEGLVDGSVSEERAADSGVETDHAEDPEAEAVVEVVADAELVAEEESEAELEVAADAELVAEAEPEAGVEVAADAELVAEAGPEGEVEVVADIEVVAEAEAEVELEVAAASDPITEDDILDMVQAVEEPADPLGDTSPEVAADQRQLPSAPEEPLAVEIEAGDDLETVAEFLEEEGPAEVVAFDEPAGFDVELAVEGDQLFDSAEAAIIVQAEEAAGDLFDEADARQPLDTEVDALFDGVDEPLKTQSGH